MKQIDIFDVICPFCGKVRQGKTITDDGYDWEGHHRGHENSETVIEKCSCAFGQLVKSLPHIRPMCRNCYYYVNGYCTNPKQITEIKNVVGNFNIIDNKFSVKDPNIACRMHELDYGIFDELIKE